MKTNWTLVPALPFIPEPDWNIWFNKLENPVYEIPCKLTPTEKVLLGMTEGEWLIVFHFVIKKKWLKKHKIPIKPKEAKIFEPKGTYWYWLLELCIQLHITQWGHAYDNAGHWFFCLANERRGSNLKGFDSIFQYYTTEKSQDLENQKDLNQKWLGKKIM
jgi:hypothetical protein